MHSLSNLLVYLVLSVPLVSAARPGFGWISSYADAMKSLFEGNRQSMSDFFAPNGRICFNNKCGGIVVITHLCLIESVISV